MVAEPVTTTTVPLPGRSPVPAAPAHPDPEVVARATRRTFTAAYKLRILEAAAACQDTKEVGALLRREGLYASHLSKWRQHYAHGGAEALVVPRGRKPTDPTSAELVRLQQENARLRQRLTLAEEIIAVQKKVSTLLTLSQPEQASP